ncbi:MAG: tRNA 2-selenouridine(34) synthase MnmH [Proteobacteria bacterium]|nr:tRNA 2-selenouridine(34) synthase MnmH [Pseudomonadota bacterium]
MAAPISVTQNWHVNGAKPFDMIIDVRSPSEYELDHIPGAINLPVLSDDERAEVGTIYKQQSPFKARKRGAALISKNIAIHLDETLSNQNHDWAPLVYCWRGGQRSGAMARVFSEIGWSVSVLEGGYKYYRRQVQAGLTDIANTIKPVLLDGPTGSGKTVILHTLVNQGVQVIDLEHIACHRGSVLGSIPGQKQPAQRLFESLLYDAFSRIDLSKSVVIEAESSKIGGIHIPDVIWKAMLGASSIKISAAMNARVDHILNEYDHITTQPEPLLRLIHGMSNRHGHAITNEWKTLVADKDWHGLVMDLIVRHYDPAYLGSSERRQRSVLGMVHLEALNHDDFDQAARKIKTLL